MGEATCGADKKVRFAIKVLGLSPSVATSFVVLKTDKSLDLDTVSLSSCHIPILRNLNS